MRWREAVIWGLAVVLCAVCGVIAVLATPPYQLDVDLPASSVLQTTVTSAVTVPEKRLNINVATAEELTALPGIGEVLAARIVDYRERVGGFESVEQLKEVDGIGEKKYAALKDFVCI